ncbi:hypothetical protein [Streptomyces sp. NPDC101150]|uniref:hypothetical protein n=1 Tax=Streptomyces sp. NPDC101150 TaxID=3366114 RepID=UPI0038302A9C
MPRSGHPLGNLARRAPGQQTKHRYAHHLRQAIPEHAERIVQDRAWDALTTVLAEAEASGHNAATVLDQALSQRSLDDARHPARALTWRIQRLGQRHAPGPRAQAAMARSTALHPTASASTAAALPTSQRSPARRR